MPEDKHYLAMLTSLYPPQPPANIFHDQNEPSCEVQSLKKWEISKLNYLILKLFNHSIFKYSNCKRREICLK